MVKTKRVATTTTFRDPVCGMDYPLTQTAGHVMFRDKTYDFCSHECMMKFQANPGSFLDAPEIV